jgi:hypothetical protein
MDYLKEKASRDPVGRLLTALHRVGSDSRMAKVAREADLSEKDFVSAVAEAEWGGLITREERGDAVYLKLTSPGQARVEAILRPLIA